MKKKSFFPSRNTTIHTTLHGFAKVDYRGAAAPRNEEPTLLVRYQPVAGGSQAAGSRTGLGPELDYCSHTDGTQSSPEKYLYIE